LIIGSSLTAEDVAVQLYKYGARKIIATYLHRPMGLKWPEEIEERPILRKVQAKTVFFSDDSTATVDAIIFCTGYQHHYPFLDESLKLRTKNSYSVANLYKAQWNILPLFCTLASIAHCPLWRSAHSGALPTAGLCDYFQHLLFIGNAI